MKTLFTVGLLLLSLITCKDRTTEVPKDQLPPITQTGANTAGCLIDGQVLIPKNGTSSIPIIYGLTRYFEQPGYRINIANINENRRLYIYIEKDNKVSDFIINQSNGAGTGSSISTEIFYEIKDKKYLSSDNSGIIKVTKYDYPIISGIFSASLYNKDNPSEKINITEGRFDINVATLNK